MALANVALTDTFDVWRVRTNQIIVSLSQVETSTNGSFIAANTAGVIATSAFEKANSTLFSSNVYITTSDNTNAALTITQTGTGPALVVGNTADPNTSLVVIDANSRVGIGTNTPTSNLHVIGTANITEYLTVAGMNVTFAIASAFEKANVGISNFTSNVVVSVSDNTNSALRITQTGSGNALLIEDIENPDLSPFVVDSEGSVGIGVSDPATKLHVKLLNDGSGGSERTVRFDSNSTSFMTFYNSSNAFNSIDMYSFGGTLDEPTLTASNTNLGVISFGAFNGTSPVKTASIYGVSRNSEFEFVPTEIVFETNSFDRMKISASGNVGIKQSNPSYTLDVGGSINAASLLINGVTIAGGEGGGGLGATIFGINVGNSSANTFNVAHNLNKFYTIVNVRENATGYHVYPDIRYTSPDTIEVQFVDPPSEDQYLVMILGG